MEVDGSDLSTTKPIVGVGAVVKGVEAAGSEPASAEELLPRVRPTPWNATWCLSGS